MAKVDWKLTEETGVLVEYEVEERPWRSSAATADAERGRKGGQTAQPECRRVADLNRKQSIEELTCGRIKTK